MRITSSARHAEVIEFLKQFLNAQSIAPVRTLQCAECGGELLYLPMQFWLEGGDKSWNIPLPYCPQCHPLPPLRETFVA